MTVALPLVVQLSVLSVAFEALSKIEHKEEVELVEGHFKAFEVKTPGTNISDLMYKHRDKRFDASIIHDGSVFLGEDITTYSHGNTSRWATARYAADHVPLTNYTTRKYIYTNMTPHPQPFYLKVSRSVESFVCWSVPSLLLLSR